MEALDALRRANAEAETRLRTVTSDHWRLPTPCTEWDVRALVNHLLLGTRMSVQVLDGVPREEVIAQLGDDLMDDVDDPTEFFVELAGQVVERFAAPGGLDGVVAHPMGDIPRSTFLGFRVVDAAVHSWDLATAIGSDDTLDPDLVRWIWDDTAPSAELIAASGMFSTGRSDAVADDAPLQTRLLDLLGRRVN